MPVRFNMLRAATARIRLVLRVPSASFIVRFKSSESSSDDTPNDAIHDKENAEDHSVVKKNPLQPWPDGINPHTGERGGPAGPEPTRYGDWERKGRVSDF